MIRPTESGLSPPSADSAIRPVTESGMSSWRGPACDVCGSVDRLGLGTCVSCAGPRPSSLIFVEASMRRADREVLEAWLVGVLDGEVTRNDAHEAAIGIRPLVGLSVGAARRAARALTLRGVDVAIVPRASAWKRLPRGMIALAGVVGAVGLLVGLTGTPPLLVLGPAFVILLVLAAFRELRLPALHPTASRVLGLPEEAETEVRATLARLAAGTARQRLKELVTLAAVLFEDGRPRTKDLRLATEELLRLACDAVVDLDRLDRSFRVLERPPGGDEPDRGFEAALAAAEEAHDAVCGQLDEALSTLARAQATTTDAPAALLRAARTLAEESRHRADAWREVQRITAWCGGAENGAVDAEAIHRAADSPGRWGPVESSYPPMFTPTAKP